MNAPWQAVSRGCAWWRHGEENEQVSEVLPRFSRSDTDDTRKLSDFPMHGAFLKKSIHFLTQNSRLKGIPHQIFNYYFTVQFCMFTWGYKNISTTKYWAKWEVVKKKVIFILLCVICNCNFEPGTVTVMQSS
jgi:hypothetical protein